ncbi:MAG: hypothetical protein ACTSXH_11145 [Promethearchaeota archaeon]
MKPWKVLIKIPNNSKTLEKKLHLMDIRGIFNGYLRIRRTYFNSLIKAIKISQKYNSHKGIEKIMNPEDKDWTNNAWILLLIKDLEKMKSFWFLIKREKNLSGILVAIGPKPFLEYTLNNSEAKRSIKRLLNYIISYINKFECIILVPNFLTHLH